MNRNEELNRLLRRKEYEEDEQQSKILAEAAENYSAAIRAKIYDKNAPIRHIRHGCQFVKEMLCECVCDLYESALVIDRKDVDEYSKNLREAMRDECMSIMESASTINDLKALFENASPYVKNMIVLAEEAYDNKTSEEIKAYDDKVILGKDDFNLIKKFEADEGKDVYATGLQDRVIDVYKAEEKLGEQQRDKVQAVVDELSRIKSSTGADKTNTPMSECIEKGINLFNTTPKSLFNAIFVNKSKSVMTESASADLSENEDIILAETIAIYTLYETIHALGIKTYSDEEQRKLKMEFFVN